MESVLVTGSSGLIGSEVCRYFAAAGYKVDGIDNNQRAVFFGPQGDTRWNQHRLEQELPGFVHHEIDIRDREGLAELVGQVGRIFLSIPPLNLLMISRRLFHSMTSIPTRWARSTSSKLRAGGARKPLLST